MCSNEVIFMYRVKWFYWVIAVLIVCVGGFLGWEHHHRVSKPFNWDSLAQGSEQQMDSPINQSETKSDRHSEKHKDSEPPASIMVDIEGQVKKPGVYTLTAEARIIDVVEQAGGLKATADKRRINLAKKATDEMMIYIPKQGEEGGDALTVNDDASEATEAPGMQEKININTADLTKIEEIPGIGEIKAQAIIDYRSDNGSFKSVDDLLNVTGIGEKSLEKMKAVVTVD